MTQPPFLIRAIYYLLIGWWLSGIWAAVAYVLMVSIVGLPLGAMMMNSLPTVMTLRARSAEYRFGRVDTLRQYPFVLRAIYFILIGWWLGAAVVAIAWTLCATIIGLPIGLWLINQVPFATTLMRY